MKKKILTSGVDSEYVLSGLCDYLRQNNWDVTEIDFGSFKGNPVEALKDFKPHEVIYITSAHTNITLRVANIIAPKLPELYPNYLSPLEFIKLLKPSRSIYVPHDLLTPFGDTNLNEFRYLDLFDYILAPTDSPALQATLGPNTRVIGAGWIKHAGLSMAAQSQFNPGAPPKVALFVSMLEHLRCKYGIEGFVRYLAPLLAPNVRIKLPAWKGVDEIEAALRAHGSAEVIPAGESSISLMLDSDVVICNSASSIHAEAALMGRQAICLLDDEGISAAEQRSKLKDLPGIHFHDYRNRQAIPQSLLVALASEKRPPMPPFDYGLVERLITTGN